MAKAMKILMAAVIGAALIVPQAAEAQKRRPGAKAVTISQPKPRQATKKDKTHTSRKQMVSQAKAAVKRGKGTLKTARRNLKGVTRSEARNRQARTNAKNTMDQAKQAYRANKTPANFARWNAAYRAYMPVRQQHETSLSALRAQRARVTQLANFQVQAVGAVRQAQGLRKAPPRAGRPQFANRPAQFVRPVSAYDRVPGPQAIYGPGPAARVNTQTFEVRNAAQTGLPAPGQYDRVPPIQNAYQQAGSALAF